MDELLKILQKNALETRENIARMLGLPLAEVETRIADYEKRGVIRGYQAILNEDELDLEKVTAVIEVKVTPQREGGFDTIAQRISRFPEVSSAYLMSGTYDLLLFIQGRTLREVAAFVSERLSPLEGVLSTSTHFMLKTYKRLGVLMRAQQHRQSTIRPHVDRQRNRLVPKHVDVRAVKARVGRIDRRIVSRSPIRQSRHPHVERLDDQQPHQPP